MSTITRVFPFARVGAGFYERIQMSSALKIVQRRFPQVSKIVDSRKPLSIEVTGRDVNSAKRKDHQVCAMAVACKRKFKLDGVIISVKRAYAIKGNRAVRFDIPETVSREIVSFDRGAEFVPGNYRLNAIPKSSRSGRSTPRAPRPNGGRKRPYAHIHKTEGIRAVLGSKQDDA